MILGPRSSNTFAYTHRNHLLVEVAYQPLQAGIAYRAVPQRPRAAPSTVMAQGTLPLPQVPSRTPMAMRLSPSAIQPRRQVPLNDMPSMVTGPRPLGRSSA